MLNINLWRYFIYICSLKQGQSCSILINKINKFLQYIADKDLCDVIESGNSFKIKLALDNEANLNLTNGTTTILNNYLSDQYDSEVAMLLVNSAEINLAVTNQAGNTLLINSVINSTDNQIKVIEAILTKQKDNTKIILIMKIQKEKQH